MASGQDDNSISAELSSKLWYEAVQNLTKEEKECIHDFYGHEVDNHGIVNDVLKTAKEKQKEAEDKNWTFKRSDGRVVVVREIFSKIVDWITKFQGAVDFLVSLDVSGHTALPWAGVKFLLSIAVKDSQKWGSVIAGMEFVTREISYYGIFEVIYLRRKFSATQQLSNALVQAYTKILQFLSGARRYYDQNSFKRFLGTAFSLDENLSAIVSAIKSERDDIERLRGLINGQQAKEMEDGIVTLSRDQKVNQERLVGVLNDLAAPMEIMAMQLTDVKDEISEMHSEMKTKNKAEELPKIYAHLQPGKMTNYETKLGNLTPGTATWILQNRTFTEWLQGKTAILFVCGGPGTGKSHLSTKVIDYLRKIPQEASQRQNRVGYYYFKDGEKSTRSVLTALCGIVYQIAAEDEIYRMHATQICDRSPNFAMATCGTVWNDFLAAEHGATCDKQLFLVFDGIDEAERDEFADFLKILSTSVLQSIRVQILLVGRPEMDSVIRERYVELPFDTIEVSSKVNIDDVRKFSQSRYDEFIKVPKTLKGLRHKVTETLTEKADGMFLWVDLIYKEELQNILSPMKLKEALGKLPEGGLNNLYDHIFLRVELESGPAKHQTLQELFSWAAYFKEPLSLFYLNEILNLLIGQQYSDAEVILKETCASLFILVKTGEVLLEESSRSDTEHKFSEHNERQDNTEAKVEEENCDHDNDDDEENYDDEKEMAEILEANEQHRMRQQEIFVTLRHASLGDYLRRADLKPTAILLGAKQGQIHVVIKMLQIVCEGSDAPQELWLYLMANFLDQLRSLDCSMVSESDTKLIIGYLHEIFTSESLGRHIAKFHAQDDGYPLLGVNFSFGLNTGQENDNSLLIRQWLRKAQEIGLSEWDSEISNWVGYNLENPLKLLIPLVTTCISEWLACKEDGFELYWRFRFIWQCVLSTDLVPPVPQRNTLGLPRDATDFPAILLRDSTDFLGDNAFTFIAGLLKPQKTMEMHFVVAKTISYTDPGCGAAIAEYQKAIKMAQEQGSNDVLKEFYLQQIMNCVDVRLFSAEEHALEAIENYLKLDDSNAKVLACLGVVHIENNDHKGAIEHFQKSLELNKEDDEVGIALLRTLFVMKDYESIMSRMQYYGVLTVGSWLRNTDDICVHKEIMHAARMVNKVDMVIKCYEHEIKNVQLSDEELREVKDDDPVKTTRKTLQYRRRRVATSSMFRVYLGWLYLEILGQPDEAFELWKTAFFERSEFFNMGNLTSSQFTTDFIPDFFALFSQLIYEKALDPNPEVAGQMILHLEHLHRREKVSQELDKYPIGTGLRNVNLLLARLYLKYGRKDEARKMLNDQLQSAIDILEDKIGWNDEFGYGALAALLYVNGQLEKAEVALSLKRFFTFGFDIKREKGKDDTSEHAQDTSDSGDFEREDGEGKEKQPPLDKQDDIVSTSSDNDSNYLGWKKSCGGGYTCQYEPRGLPYAATVYTCTTCANVNFCETCFHRLHVETGQRKLFICSPSHDFIKTPPKGLEQIKDKKITMNGKSISFTDWVAEVRKEWKMGFCFKS